MSIKETGFVTVEDLREFNLMPSEARFEKGSVAVIECVQEIPCNPCEAACPQKAIDVGEPITKLPVLDEAACSGCGICVAQCPGLAIFIVDKTYSDSEATVSFPYEYTPLPAAGDAVKAVSRSGEVVADAKVVKVLNPKSFNKTPVVTIAVPKDLANVARSIVRI